LKSQYARGSAGLGLDVRGYDVAPDGQRLIVIKQTTTEAAPPRSTASITVMAH
jgi:hypothetical protein